MITYAKSLFVLLTVFFLGLTTSSNNMALAEEELIEEDEFVPSQAFDKGVFWKIEKDGQIVGHIFGTIHMNDELVVNIRKNVMQAFDDAKSFSLEAFPSDHYWNPYHGNQSIVGEMMLPEGQTLKDLIGEPLYSRVEKALTELNVKKEIVMQLRPWAAMRSFAIPAKQEGEILDYILLDRAIRQKKEIFQVESIEEFLVTLQEMPLDVQIKLLEFTVDSYPKMSGIIQDMLVAYIAEDLEKMYRTTTTFIPEDKKNEQIKKTYLKHVIEIRNIVMEHYMRKPLRDRNSFIAVGAVHLYGKDGVLALMEKDGYTVTRVKMDDI